MATLLVKLRNVPDDELEEIHDLLEEHGIEVYETDGGSWGMSLPALWLQDDGQLELAKSLLAEYQRERCSRARREYEILKRMGKARTFMDLARENPVRYILYVALAIGLAYISIAPFVSLMGG